MNWTDRMIVLRGVIPAADPLAHYKAQLAQLEAVARASDRTADRPWERAAASPKGGA